MTRTLLLLALSLSAGSLVGAEPSVAFAEEKAPSAEELFAHLARGEGFSADFVEVKKIAFLKAPLENRGRMYFAPPGRFARHVDAPTRSSLFIDGDALVVVDAAGKKSIDLGATPAVKELLHSVLHLLAGKRAAIEALYTFDYSVDGPRWRLRLTPKSESLRGILSRLEFSGTGRSLGEMQLFEASGDSSVTRFHSVQHSRKFSAAELKKYLTAPGQ